MSEAVNLQQEIQLIPLNLTNSAEAQEVVEAVIKYYPQSPFPPSIESLAKSSDCYFRANYQGETIGITGYSPKTPYLVETIKTIIFHEYRGKGLGKLLSQAIEDECKAKGIKKIMSCIYEFNTTMISIKIKQGYVIEGYHRDHEKPGLHEYTLGKFLN